MYFVLGLIYEDLNKRERIKVRSVIERMLKPKIYDFDEIIFLTFDSLDSLYGIVMEDLAEEIENVVDKCVSVVEVKDLKFIVVANDYIIREA